MPNYLKRIIIIGLYHRFDIIHDFSPGVNILHGVNGTGKTTLIHIITNILNGDYARFLYLDFSQIKVLYDDDNLITLKKDNQNDYIEVLVNQDRRGTKISENFDEFFEESDIGIQNYYHQQVILPTAYFPAFRIMMETWQSSEDNISLNKEKATNFGRKIFGDFTPQINYPSSKYIEERLISEIKNISKEISLFDREIIAQFPLEILSENETNSEHDINSEIFKQIEEVLAVIKSYPILEEFYFSANTIYTNIKKIINSEDFNKNKNKYLVLKIFYKFICKIHQKIQDEYSKISNFLESINSFLEDKKIEICKTTQKEDPQTTQEEITPQINIIFDDGYVINGLDALSSGERQILTILFATTYIGNEKLVVIDEPELSLHIDWQRKLLKKISEQLNNVQIIACTHSPMIAADHKFMQLELKRTDKYLSVNKDNEIAKSEDELEDIFCSDGLTTEL